VNQFSQHREFRADAGSAKLLGEKSPMIKALQKLQIITRGLDTKSDQLATMKIFGHG
jgi:Zn-dependent protease with chaperone function